jgi:hypothetical protein
MVKTGFRKKIKEEVNAMSTKMRRMLITLFASGILSVTALSHGLAANTASVYITLRCTATVSIELFSRPAGALVEKTTTYNFGNVSAASTYVSTAPIGVRNNSSGAITRWALDVTSIDNGWTMGSTPGLNRTTLYAKFSTATLSSTDFDVTNDTVPNTSQPGEAAKTYSLAQNYFYSYCKNYTEQTYTQDVSFVLPMSFDSAPEGRAERQLWLKILTPTAVENPNTVTTIVLRITAS